MQYSHVWSISAFSFLRQYCLFVCNCYASVCFINPVLGQIWCKIFFHYCLHTQIWRLKQEWQHKQKSWWLWKSRNLCDFKCNDCRTSKPNANQSLFQALKVSKNQDVHLSWNIQFGEQILGQKRGKPWT